MSEKIRVIGAGLAGTEAAWQIARRGIEVELFEMKPARFSPAHGSPDLAELVCSNSLKAMRIESAAGLLKEEMRSLSSLLIECAEETAVPAGGALAVDRNEFSRLVTRRIESEPLITVVRREISELPKDGVTVVATGPLTSEALANDISELCGGRLSFFDAAAPVVSSESIDSQKVFAASRYGRGEDDYLNCPMDKELYESFIRELKSAQRAPLHGADASDPKVYEGCMPIEILAQRGDDAARFGPMKPVGLVDPKTGHRPWANVQLRPENRMKTLYNMVGFQTNLKFGEQKRVFGLIPGLENAEFVRFGVMHRNSFINSPKLLAADYSMRSRPRLFFAGQITGVEGYMESAASGLIAGINAARAFAGRDRLVLPETTMIGALAGYVSGYCGKDFQPMGANFGILPPLERAIRDKKERYKAFAERALEELAQVSAD